MLNWAESFISLMHNASSRLWLGDLFRPDAINYFLLLFSKLAVCMGTPILTPEWIHKAWEHRDDM